MGIFSRRRRPTPPPPGGHDSVLPTLEADAADRLMVLAREHLATRGLETTINAGYLEADDGEVFGLHNLAAAAARAPEKEWPQMVGTHLDVLLDKPVTEGPPDPGSVLVRLHRPEEMPSPPEYAAPEVLPGLLAVLAIDTPTHVAEPMHLPEVLPDVQTGMQLALSNLRDLPAPDHDSVLVDQDDPTSRVHVLVTDDYFGASRVLVLDEVLEQAGIASPPGGLLLAIPFRHVLVVLPVAGPGVLPGLQWLAQFAAGEFETQPGPVTPHVYHRAADGSTSVITRRGEGGIDVVVEGAFARAFTDAVEGDED
ncbi:hypothetical protein [Janibacter hoylei]|uniref:hypothetical protein n=1 Tax=Janibacter hoylei TaxID=364298 RepID=UPI00248FDB2B|nr:hypothetical protein [Janibacter hoylei]